MNLATVLFTLVSLAQLITGNFFFFLVNSVNTLRKYTYKTSKIHYSAGYSALAIHYTYIPKCTNFPEHYLYTETLQPC